MRCTPWALGIALAGALAILPQGPVLAGPVSTPGVMPGGSPAGACMKPGVPVCMDDTTTFVSADKMSACQFEVKEYVDRTMDYLKCLNEENTVTGQDMTRNVERFNCRLSGNRSCK